MKDKYSADRIKMLSPYKNVRQTFSDFIDECEKTFGITIRIMMPVFRTIAAQDALYAQGRTSPGSIVTNAKGGSSFHNYGLAIDICEVKEDGTIDWNYNNGELDEIAKKYGLEWGGDWHTKDRPHFQITFGYTWQQLFDMPKDIYGYVIL